MVSKAVKISMGSIGAALYGLGAMITVYIQLGPVNFLRPAIVIPMVIASVFGPYAGFLCGAFGNLITGLIAWGPDPGILVGFLGAGIGAVVTSLVARVANRFKGIKRIVGVVLAAVVGLAWVTGLVIGIFNLLIGYVPNLEIALTVASIVGIGNTIFACTVFPLVEAAVRKFMQSRGLY